VALVGLEPERLEALAAELGPRATWFEADVTDWDALERAADGTVQRFGGIDVAIANAGIAYVGALATCPIEHVERTLEVNLMGVWRTDRVVARHVMARGGYILNIASLSAIAHAPLMGPYTASKAGTEALTDALRVELAPTGTRVGCAYFGFIDTDITRGSFALPAAQAMKKLLPGPVGKPIKLEKAIDAIERGIERRSARLWAPWFVGPMMRFRGFTQPISERMAIADRDTLEEALRLAAEPNPAQDNPLGAAAVALDE
jgi:NAD(P)-dependent dehydrogenase (short-subunit alcohol dehydrogenase family)